MGIFEKVVQESEFPVFKKLAKSIVSTVDITIGTPITIDMLTTKGPGTGISPMKWDDIIGTRSKLDYIDEEIIFGSLIYFS